MTTGVNTGVNKEVHSNTRCGLVALVGPTNAGKSSLLNRLVESELALVSRKAQTTRFAVRGVLTEGKSQVVFLDFTWIFYFVRADC